MRKIPLLSRFLVLINNVFILFIGLQSIHLMGMESSKSSSTSSNSSTSSTPDSDYEQNISLNHAIEINKPDLLQSLINKGYDPNYKGHHEKTPLAQAITAGNKKCIQLLLAFGAFTNNEELASLKKIFDNNPENKLSQIIITTDNSTVEEYLTNNYSFNNTTDSLTKNSTIALYDGLELAVGMGKYTVVQTLLKHPSSKYYSRRFITKLVAHLDFLLPNSPSGLPIELCHQETAFILLGKLKNRNCQIDLNYYPSITKLWQFTLRVLAKQEKIDQIKQFLAKLVSIDTKKRTALHYAVWGDIPSHLVKELITPETINGKDNTRSTPLHYAVLRNNQELTLLLLQQGADPTNSDMIGNTPLHHAAAHGYQELIEILISFPYDRNARNWELQTPYDCAINNHHTKTANLLAPPPNTTSQSKTDLLTNSFILVPVTNIPAYR